MICTQIDEVFTRHSYLSVCSESDEPGNKSTERCEHGHFRYLTLKTRPICTIGQIRKCKTSLSHPNGLERLLKSPILVDIACTTDKFICDVRIQRFTGTVVNIYFVKVNFIPDNLAHRCFSLISEYLLTASPDLHYANYQQLVSLVSQLQLPSSFKDSIIGHLCSTRPRCSLSDNQNNWDANVFLEDIANNSPIYDIDMDSDQ